MKRVSVPLGIQKLFIFFPEEGRVLLGTPAVTGVAYSAWLLFGTRGSGGVLQLLGIPGIVL